MQPARNYGGFDSKLYGKIQSNFGSIYVEKSQYVRNEPSIGTIFFYIRISIENKIQSFLPKETSGILLGILLGKKEEMSAETVQSFRDSSLIHMLCVSGAHVSYITIGLLLLISKLSSRKKTMQICVILGLLFFMGITGFSASVARACIMGILMLIAKIVLKRPDTINQISFSLVLLLLLNPFYLLDIGLLLSYGGTIGIITFSKIGKSMTDSNQNKWIIKIKEMLWVCFSAQVIIMPITAYFFNNVNLTFFLSNILVAPLFGMIILGGFLALFLSYICPLLSMFVGKALHMVLWIFQSIASFFARLPFSNITVITISPYLIGRLLHLYCFFLVILPKNLFSRIQKIHYV